jgi:hypothetical protein
MSKTPGSKMKQQGRDARQFPRRPRGDGRRGGEMSDEMKILPGQVTQLTTNANVRPLITRPPTSTLNRRPPALVSRYTAPSAEQEIGQARLSTLEGPPAWTATPPTEPGWYWKRIVKIERYPDKRTPGGAFPICLSAEDLPHDIYAIYEWWPVRIEEPPR